ICALVLTFILVGVAGPESHAQECMQLRRDEIRHLTAEGASGRPTGCSVGCKGCGCRGGPGYRDTRGKCVSYKKLISRCGEAPHAGCTRECFPVAKGCARPNIDGAKA